MANNDNTVLPGTGETYGADAIVEDIDGVDTTVKYQRVKLIQGREGINDGDVADGINPLPVVDKSADELLKAILLELRAMHLHLEEITNAGFSTTDVELGDL